MQTFRTRAFAAALAAAAVLSIAASAPSSEPSEPAAEQASNLDLDLLYLDDEGLGRVMVRYEDGTVPDGLLDQLTDLGVARGLEFSTIGTVAVTATPEVLAEVLTDPRVEAFHQQRRISLDLYASREQINAEEADQPRDYQQEVDGEAVTRTRPGVTGEGVTVGVVDSGIEVTHPDLANTVLGLNFSFSAIDEEGGEAGVLSDEDWDTYAEETGDLALQDDIGHGTHVGSTIGGSGELAAQTSGTDLSGVAPGVELISLKITTVPAGIVEDFDFEESVVAAFDYILRHNDELGITVTNNSWGLLPTEPNCLGALPDGCFGLGEETDFDAARAISDAVVASGVDVIFSAGNSYQSDDGSSTIGDHVGFDTITVAAACKSVDSGCAEGQDTTDFSSRGAEDGTGRQVDVTAPGDQILAALTPKSVLTPLTECPQATAENPGYFCISGTSMSAPHIAGVAALLREASPDITPAQVKACILDTADPLPNELGLPEAQVVRDGGAGMVNTEAALQCAHELTPITAAGDGAAGDTTAPAPDPAAETPDLAATGGGAALLALPLLLGVVAVGRRRR